MRILLKAFSQNAHTHALEIDFTKGLFSRKVGRELNSNSNVRYH